MNARAALVAGALAGLLTVLLGAVGAHALHQATAMQAVWWEKAVRYQGLHALALLATGLIQQRHGSIPLRWAAVFFVIGIVLFCGSLYLLALSGNHLFGRITPFGGTAFLLGWILLTMGAWRMDDQ